MRFIVFAVVVALACPVLLSQTTRHAEERRFDLTAVAPPRPALTYQFRFDDLTDRRPGNAALLYMNAVLLMAPDASDKSQRALAAFEAKDMQTFHSLADELSQPAMFEELELAARREQCDWQPTFREKGVHMLLPYLEPLFHGVARSIKVRALREIQEDKPLDTINTLRLGYELSDKTGRHPNVISSLIALNITRMMNDCLALLMNRADAPNLYWALVAAPSRRTMLRDSQESQRMSGELFAIPDLIKVKNGQSLSAEQWRAVFAQIVALNAAGDDSATQKPLDPVTDTSPQLLGLARRDYAGDRHITDEQTARIDPAVILGTYYFKQAQICVDEMCKLRGLSYPQFLSKAAAYDALVAKWVEKQPANPFLPHPQHLDRIVWRFASCDRETAALAAVEAIRSYAAANNGRLPALLDDITDTPVPNNPATDKPFEYQVQGETAVLADSQSRETQTYVIRIRR